MDRFRLAICLVSLTTCGFVGRVHADPIKLSMTGYAFDAPVNFTSDVSDGFTGASLPLRSSPVGAVYGSIPEGGGRSIDSSIQLQATLFDSIHNLATLTLSGPIQGGLSHPYGSPNVDGSVQGTASQGSLHVLPGVDPGAIPA